MLTRAFIFAAAPESGRSPNAAESRIGSRLASLYRPAVGFCAAGMVLVAGAVEAAGTSYPLEVLPPEFKRMTDPQTGAELLFLFYWNLLV